LGKANFLQNTLLELWIGVNDSVVIGDSGASCRLLTDYVEIVVLRNDTLADQRARYDIIDLTVYIHEESFIGLYINHEHSESNFAIGICLVNELQRGIHKKLVE